MKRFTLSPLFVFLLSITLTVNPFYLSSPKKSYLAPARTGIPLKEKLEQGDTFNFAASVSQVRQNGYAGFSEDHNWPHLDAKLATALFQKTYGKEGVILHGMHTSTLSLDALALELEKSIRTPYKIVSEESNYRWPVFVGEEIQFSVSVSSIDDSGEIVVKILGKNNSDKDVLIQSIILARDSSEESLLDSKVLTVRKDQIKTAYPSLEPTKRVPPPWYLVGTKRDYYWEMNEAKLADLAALFESEKFSNVKLAKAISTYAAVNMFPSSLFLKSKITDIGREIPLTGKLKIEAKVIPYRKKGEKIERKWKRTLTQLTIKDESGHRLFRAEIDMYAFPFTKDELKKLSRTQDKDGVSELEKLLKGRNQYEYELFFDEVLKRDISGVEFIDEYWKAIAQDPGKTLEAAIEKIEAFPNGHRVLVAGVGGIGGGFAEGLGKLKGVKLAVLTRNDKGSLRLKKKFLNAGITDYIDVRVEDDQDLDSYRKAVFEAHQKLGGIDTMAIGTGISHDLDTLTPVVKDEQGRPRPISSDRVTVEDVNEHAKISEKIYFVNHLIVDAIFGAASALEAKNIFVVGSVHGVYPRNDWVKAYAVSKAANSALAKQYPAFTTKRKGAIGISLEGDYILSQMTAKHVMAVLRGTQLGFVMTPKQVAEAALWLIAFHDHEQLGYMKEHRKKPGVMLPDTTRAREDGIHQISVPGTLSVKKIHEKLGSAKKPKEKAPQDETPVFSLKPGQDAILDLGGRKLHLRLGASPSLLVDLAI